jgi:hypothetical protein
MGVEWHFIFILVVFPKVLAEPVREGGIDPKNGLADFPSFNCSTTAAGIIGNDKRKSRVGNACPKRGLAEPGVADYSHFGSINIRVVLEIVERPAQSPSPSSNGAPLIIRPTFLAGIAK